MTFSLKYEVQDFVRAYEAYAARSPRRWFTRFGWTVAIVLILIGILGSTGPKGNFATAAPAFLLAGFWFYFATTVWKRAGRRSYSGRPELTQEYKVGIDDAGIVFDGPISGARWTWAVFVKFLESNETFLVYLSPCAFVILPKRSLSPGQADQLRELLKEKLPSK
jgi:hypothetical protein